MYKRQETSSVLELARQQLDEYFLGIRRSFEIPLHPVGTDFQRKVWNALLDIPYGETRSYKEIAQSIGNPNCVRAVAGAIGANGISILIPCHRIIGSNRSLTGFAGGLEAKRILLCLLYTSCFLEIHQKLKDATAIFLGCLTILLAQVLAQRRTDIALSLIHI